MSSSPDVLFNYISEKHVVLCLSFIGGYIDATGYVKLYGLFTSSITGNLVVASTAFFGTGHGVFARIFVSLLFSFGAFATTIAIVKLRSVEKRSKWQIGIELFRYEMVCLLIALIFGVSVDYSSRQMPEVDSWQVIIIGSLLALSMGVHNATAQDLITNCPSTTVMTMTIVKTSIAAGHAFQYYLASRALLVLHPPHDKPADYDQRMLKNYQTHFAKLVDQIQPLILFVIGATVGAVLTLNMSFWSLFLPMLIVCCLMGSIYSAEIQHNINTKSENKRESVEIESATSPMTAYAVLEVGDSERVAYEERVAEVDEMRGNNTPSAHIAQV